MLAICWLKILGGDLGQFLPISRVTRVKLSEWKRKGADVVNQSRWTRSTNASLVLDAEGREIDGNDDGQPGGNYVATLNKQGVISAAISSARAPGRISVPGGRRVVAGRPSRCQNRHSQGPFACAAVRRPTLLRQCVRLCLARASTRATAADRGARSFGSWCGRISCSGVRANSERGRPVGRAED